MAGSRPLLVVLVTLGCWCQCALGLHPHTHLSTIGLIRARGYPAEAHYVSTQDGYIIEIHRIPDGRLYQPNDQANQLNRSSQRSFSRPLHLWDPRNVWNRFTQLFNFTRPVNARRRYGRDTTSASVRPKPVVFLQHGVLCSSADFVMNDPQQALGFILADLGYDVWLGNVRGNTYGRYHRTISPKLAKFWDYSWDTIAQYDMPAMLGYVRRKTGVEKVDYIGHSMGTTIFFTMLNYHPHINSWVHKMVAMAPSAYIHNTSLGLKMLSPLFDYYNRLQKSGNSKKPQEFKLSRTMKDTLATFCGPYSPTQSMCTDVIAAIGGPSVSNSIDKHYLPVIVAHTPAGGSNNILAHYSQLVMSHKYQAFDYGRIKNLAVYGTDKPRLFSLAPVRVPVGIFWSETDWLNSPPDVKQIASELPNVTCNYKVPLERFNHLDFVWGERASVYVYQEVIRFLSANDTHQS